MTTRQAQALLRAAMPQGACELVRRLEAAGHETWAVGGCVRDVLLGRPPCDWDFTADAGPQEMGQALSGCIVVPTGERHGTVSVHLAGGVYEVTMMRTERGGDGRHPAQVCRTHCLSEDLARRDYTVNAMAYHPQRGLRDEHGGLGDLSRRCLRTVGEPSVRFLEDHLRILRGLRFAACLGFEIEPAAAEAMRRCQDRLGTLSGERIRQELLGLVCGGGWCEALSEYGQVLAGAGGGWESWHFPAKGRAALKTLPPDGVLRLSMLLWEHPQRERALERLRLSRVQHGRCLRLWAGADALMQGMQPDREALCRWVSGLGEGTCWEDAHALLCALRPELVPRCEALHREGVPLFVHELGIRGEELIAQGLASPGPQVGECLRQQLERRWRAL